MPLTALDQLRQAAGRDLSGSNDAGERYFGQKIKGAIDDFISDPSTPMAAGSGPEAAGAIQNARDLAQRNFKYQDLQSTLGRAADFTGKGTTGNVEGPLRDKMMAFQNSQKSLSPAEAALTQQAIRGTPVQNILRQVGKAAPTSFLPAAGELGSAMTGAPGLATGIAGAGLAAKHGSAAMEDATVRNLMATILRGGTAAPAAPPVNTSALANALAAYVPTNRR